MRTRAISIGVGRLVGPRERNGMAKRAAIYVRVSSEQQASEGKGSLGDQGRELKVLPISTVTASWR